MITEAELGRLLIYQAKSDKVRRSAGWPTLEEDVLHNLEIEENLEAMRDPFPMTPEQFASRW